MGDNTGDSVKLKVAPIPTSPSRTSSLSGVDRTSIQAILELLPALENLAHLDLPDSSSIGVGFNGGPGCGNVYFGKHGREYRPGGRQIDREARDATELGGKIVVANMPQLKSFTIGGQKPEIIRSEEGQITLT